MGMAITALEYVVILSFPWLSHVKVNGGSDVDPGIREAGAAVQS